MFSTRFLSNSCLQFFVLSNLPARIVVFSLTTFMTLCWSTFSFNPNVIVNFFYWKVSKLVLFECANDGPTSYGEVTKVLSCARWLHSVYNTPNEHLHNLTVFLMSYLCLRVSTHRRFYSFKRTYDGTLYYYCTWIVVNIPWTSSANFKTQISLN